MRVRAAGTGHVIASRGSAPPVQSGQASSHLNNLLRPHAERFPFRHDTKPRINYLSPISSSTNPDSRYRKLCASVTLLYNSAYVPALTVQILIKLNGALCAELEAAIS